MAATVQLTIQTNEQQVRASLNAIQQQINQMVNRPYTIQINTQFSPQGLQNLQQILNITNTIRANSNVTIHVNTVNNSNTINDLRQIDNGLTLINNNMERGAQNADLFGNTFRRVFSYAKKYVNEALAEMKKVDTELVTIQKVTGETEKGMKRFADDAYTVAAKLGASASEYLNAVAEFSKAGFRGDTAKQLGELAITTKVVGDTTIQTANQFLLAVNAAYKYEGSIEKLTAVLDGANEIGNNYATSVDKIAQGLGKISPIAAQAHVGIDELSAAIGTITAVTQRSGTEAATALRALYLNIIGDTKTEIEDGAKWTAGEIEGLRDVLRKFAPDVVKAAEATHSLINPMEAIGALADAMKSGFLNEQKLMEMVSDIGGKLRTSQLLALIQNFKMYQDQLETYRNAAGSAAKEYAIYLDSWEAKTKQLSATWTNFVQRQIGSREIKDLLDTLIKIVDNLESFVPLIAGIGVAIAALNLYRVTQQVDRLRQSLNLLRTSGLGPLATIISVLSIAIGAWNTALKKAADSARKQAEESAKNATEAREEADAMMELVAQLAAAKEGSSDYISISASMQQALKDEGIEVKNLTEDYRELTRTKLEAAKKAAQKEYTDTGLAFKSAYRSADKSIHFGSSPTQIEGFNGRSALDKQILDMFMGSSAARFNLGSGGDFWFTASDGKTMEGIVAYYQLVNQALDLMDEEVYARFEAGDSAGADAIRKSPLYKDLMDFRDALGTEGDAYISAQEKWNSAQTAMEGFGLFNDLIDWMKQGPDKITIDQYASFLATLEKSGELTATQKKYIKDLGQEIFPQYTAQLGAGNGALSEYLKLMGELEDQSITSLDAYIAWMDALKENNNLTDEQKTILEEMAKHTYKDFAAAVLEARSALSQFNEAMQGGDKDDKFKSYKNVYDEVMKAAKRGAYGSNAFQYGIKALLDPEYIKSFQGDWAALVKGMQKDLGGLYKNGESMGRGLLDNIVKFGDKAKGSLYEIREGTELLASYNKKTGEWYISDKPEDIKKLAGKLHMSAESLVAAGIALGAMDPNADVEGLSKALETILGGGEEKLTAEQLAAEANKAAAESNKQSAQTFSDAVSAFASLAEGLKSAFGIGGNGGGAGGANGTGGAAADAQAAREAAINAARGSNAAVTPSPTSSSSHSSRGKKDKEQTWLDNHPPTNAVTDAEERGLVVHPGAGALDSANAQMAAREQDRHDIIHGGANAGKTSKIESYIDRVLGGGSSPEGDVIVFSNKDSQAYLRRPSFNGGTPTDAWGDIDMRLSAMGLGGAGSAGIGLKGLFGSIYGSIFGKSSSQGTEDAVAKGVEQGIEASSNKDTAAYHNGERGGIPVEDFLLSQFGLGSSGANGGSADRSGRKKSFIETMIDSIFGTNESSAVASGSVLSDAVAEGVESGIASSNKDTGAYHNGNRGGIPAGDFFASQYGASEASASVSASAEEATTAIEGVQQAAEELSSTPVELDIEAITEGATTDLEAILAIADQIQDKNPELKVNPDTGKADAALTALEARLDAITRARTIYISVKYGGVATDGPKIPGASPTTVTRPTGDENFHGGSVLVNDEPGGYNPELIVANGRAFIANGGDPTIISLPRGSVIYNADETRDILNGGSDLFNIPTYAQGVVPTGSGGGSGKKSSGSGGSSSSKKNSSKWNDDMMKKLQEYMEKILEAAEDALEDQLEAINAQIYALKYQTEAAEKANALEEARLELLEAEKNLLDANTERTVRYYNAVTGQWEWMADKRAVMQAQEDLYDAQKNLLKAQYDALADAWNEIKEQIEKALEKGEDIDIEKILEALAGSDAGDNVDALRELIEQILGFTDNPKQGENFDGGGLATGLGWMPKGTAGTEAVLDSSLTSAILHPQMNQAFSNFTDSLTSLFSLAGGTSLPSSRYGGNVSNMYGGNTYIEGVKIGSDMLNRPLSEVLSTLNLYVHN